LLRLQNVKDITNNQPSRQMALRQTIKCRKEKKRNRKEEKTDRWRVDKVFFSTKTKRCHQMWKTSDLISFQRQMEKLVFNTFNYFVSMWYSVNITQISFFMKIYLDLQHFPFTGRLGKKLNNTKLASWLATIKKIELE
jgi:hypothetical protein